jgi:hypothetical protein
MSYLRGPLTRRQVQQLVAEQAPAPAQTRPGASATAEATLPAKALSEEHQPDAGLTAGLSQVPPQLPSSVKQSFLSVRVSLGSALSDLTGTVVQAKGRGARDEGLLVYQPGLLGSARLRFVHTKSRQTHTEEVTYLLPLEGGGQILDWSSAEVDLDTQDLESQPERDAHFAQLPSEMGDARRYTALRKEFEDYLYYNSSITLWHNPHVDLYSEPGESHKEFQRRCRKAAESASETEAEKLKAKYERELKRIEDKLEREEQELREDKIEHDARKQEELLSGVESVFGLFSGRRSSSRLSSASRKRRMTRQARADVEESERTIEALEDEVDELEKEARQEVDQLKEEWAERIDDVEEVEVKPRRTDVQLGLFGLVWRPYWQVMAGDQVLSMPAFEAKPA